MGVLLAGTVVAGEPATSRAAAGSAVVETCQGQAATIVGTRGLDELLGTEDADVMVTAGAQSVLAGAGDDVVCVTGRTRYVDSGDGADSVTTDGGSRSTTTSLGSGSDLFRGGTGPDNVSAGSGTNRIHTGGGADWYSSGFLGEGAASTDEVNLGPGRDRASVGADNLAGALDGGRGVNTLAPVSDLVSVGPTVVDNATQTATVEGQDVLHWRRFTQFDLDGMEGGPVDFVGSAEAELVSVSHEFEFGPEVGTITTGAGDDRIRLSRVLGSVEAGPGHDALGLVDFGSERSSGLSDLVAVDLRRGRMRVYRDGPSTRVDGVEDLAVSGFATALLSGSRVANSISVGRVCSSTVRGRAGQDLLEARSACSGDLARLHGVTARFEAYGGPGDDLLVGSWTPDRLMGRAGTDRADGSGGQDVCRAETRVNCERGGRGVA
jgi:Ca2+-binding RTX toxin-like protein